MYSGPTAHVEPSRSEAANEYVWKEDTRVPGTQFEYGSKPIQRNSKQDWDQIRALAVAGELSEIPSEVFVRHYSNLRRIEKDFMLPLSQEKEVFYYYGTSGTGKSRKAWEEAGQDGYPKDPNSKFWDGYNG